MKSKNIWNLDTSIEDKTIIILCGILILAGYGFLATNIIIAGDDWTSLTINNYLGNLTIKVGRWMHYMLSWLFEGKLFAPTFTFGAFVFAKLLSVYITTNLFNFENGLQKLFFALIFVSFPIWYEAYLFQMGRVPKALGLLSSVLSASVFINAFKNEFSVKHTLPLLILASVLLTLSMGCYQTYCFFAIIIVLIYLVQSKFESLKTFLIQGFSLIGVFVFAVGLYYLVTTLFLNFHNLTIHDGGKYDIKNVVTTTSIGTTVKNNLIKIKDFYTKAQLLIPQFVKVLLLISLMIFVFKQFFTKSKDQIQKQRISQQSLKILCLLVIMVLPFILGFIREQSPLRFNSITSLSIVFAFFLSFPLIFKNWVRNVWVIVLTTVVITFTFWNSAASFSKLISNKRDFALSEKLLNYIHESPSYNSNQKTLYKIYFIGNNPYLKDNRPFDISSNSDFRIMSLINSGVWDGQIGRMKNIFNLLGEPSERFRIFPSYSADSKKFSKTHVTKNMIGSFSEVKNWPHKSSVVSLENSNTILVFFDKKALK